MAEMAETIMQNDPIRKLEDEITCPLCLGPLEQPKRLPCDHTYCKSPCLEGLLERTGNSTIVCPECRTIVQVQNNNLDNLPNAFRIQRLKDVYSEMAQASATAHTPVQGTSPPCPTHPTQLQDFYCETCQEVVCRDCILLARQHKDHEYSLITEVAQKQKMLLFKGLTAVEKLVEQNDASLAQVEQAHRDIEKEKVYLSEQIKDSFDKLFHVLQQQKQALLDTANEIVEQKLATIVAQERDLQTAGRILQRTVESVKNAVTKSTDLDVILNMSQMRGNHSEAIKTSKSVAYTPAAQPDLIARVLPPEELRQACIHTSYVRRGDPDPAKCKLEREIINDSTLGDISTFTVIVANKHDIPCCGNVTVELRTLRDGSVIRPTVTALSLSRYEVSYTPATRGRHELSVMVNGKHIINSPFRVFTRISHQQLDVSVAAITDLVGPTAVHFTGERILVTDYNHVIVYNRNLQRVARIGSDSRFYGKKLNKCSESIMDGNSNIYVTTIGDNLLHKFRKDGTHVKTVSGTGTKEGQFNFPNGMCVVDNHSLYVCDTKNCRVLLFDTDLNYMKTIKTSGTPASVDIYDRKMYVTINKRNGYIEVLTASGVSLHRIGSQALNIPVTAKVYNNLLYVTDFGNNCIDVLTLDGNLVGSFGHGQLMQPEGIAMDDDGYVYVSSGRKNVLVF